MEHHDIGLEQNAEQVQPPTSDKAARTLGRFQAPFYAFLKSAIQLGCKGAIYVSERI